MAEDPALFPVHRHGDVLFEDHLPEVPQHAAQAVAEAEQVVSHLDAEAVVPADGENGHAGGLLRGPARAVAAAVALRQPAQLLDGRLAFADAREAEIAVHADRPRMAEPTRTPSIAYCGYLRSPAEFSMCAMPVSQPDACS